MRPIDADALHEIRFTDIFNENVRHSKSKLYMLGWNDAIDAIIYDTPTVDAVPVIRCKDCKHWLPHEQFGFDYDNGEYHNYCALLVPEDDDYYAFTREADEFCSRAERKEE